MPKECNAFDFNTIADVVLHLKYTARDGGGTLKRDAKQSILNAIADTVNKPLARLFSLKHEFPTEWYRFLHPADSENKLTLQFTLAPERFPFQFRVKNIQISQVELFFKPKDEKDPASTTGKTYAEEYAAGTALRISLTSPGASGSLTSSPAFMGGIGS